LEHMITPLDLNNCREAQTFLFIKDHNKESIKNG